MTALEEALSRTFAEIAETPAPSRNDLAGRAIAHGRKMRRRRRWAGASALAGCVLAIAMAISLVGGGAPRSTPANTLGERGEQSGPAAVDIGSPVPIAMVTGGQLVEPDEDVLPLSITGKIVALHQMAQGYILREVERPPGNERVWYVDPSTRAASILVRDATWVAAARDGNRVAWVSGDDMFAADVVPIAGGADLSNVRVTTAPANGGPVGFVGDAVLLALRSKVSSKAFSSQEPFVKDPNPEGAPRSSAEPGDRPPVATSNAPPEPTGDTTPKADRGTPSPDHSASGGTDSDQVVSQYAAFDVWYPSRGQYRSTWVGIHSVFGARGGGKELVAAVADVDNGLCLAGVWTEQLVMSRRVCGMLPATPTAGSVSANEKWLVVTARDQVAVYGLTGSFEEMDRRVVAMPGVFSSVSWLTDDCFVVRSRQQAAVVSLDERGKIVYRPIPDDAVIAT